MPGGQRRSSRGKRQRRSVGQPPTRGRGNKPRPTPSRPRKRLWELDESDTEEYVVNMDSDSDSDFIYNDKPKNVKSTGRRSSSNRAAASNHRRKQNHYLDGVGLEEEEEDTEGNENNYSDDNDDSDADNNGTMKYEDEEYVVDMSEYDDDDADAASVASSTRRRRRGRSTGVIRASQEPVRCVWIEDRPNLSPLELPSSSQDLLLPNEFFLRALEIYEVCRRFGNIVKLSPFLFEDFCAALMSMNQNRLLDEIHVALLRSVLKDDETNQVTFGPVDIRDSVNISIHLLDQYTYGEVIRRYLDSDERFTDHRTVLDALEDSNYPFVGVDKRLIVLGWLSQLVLATQAVRNELAGEGVIQHDDHCRECGKLGDLLCCDTCPAVYHTDCCNPPLEKPPSSGWQCEICVLHDVAGVSECKGDVEKFGQLIRQDTLGYDRHGRRYTFLVRRLFIEDEKTGEVVYYSSLAQIRQLLTLLDEEDLERELCQAINEIENVILTQMTVTEELTEKRFQSALKTNPTLKQSYLSMDKRQRMKRNRRDDEVERSDHDDENEQSIKQMIQKIDAALGDVQVVLEECAISKSTSTHPPPPAGKMTRSRTGNLPKSRLVWDPHKKDFILKDEETKEIEDNDEPRSNASVNEDNIKVTPSELDHKTSLEPGQLYKLGQDQEYMRYNNQYSSNPLSKSPYLRAEERNRSKYMANRFSMEDQGEFKWPVDQASTPERVIRMLKASMMVMVNRIALPLVHPRLSTKDNFQQWKSNLFHLTNNAEQLASALATYEAHMRPVLFSDTYQHSLGHTKFYRSTVEDKEERQRKEKIRRKDASQVSERCAADPNDETTSLVWVKYTLLDGPPKHQIWKLRDELYRVNGDGQLGGWLWVRKNRNVRWVEIGCSASAAGPIWECEHGEIIDQLLMHLAYGEEEEQEMAPAAPASTDAFTSASFNGTSGSSPLCAELPVEFDESTATFEVNGPKAVDLLGLRHHMGTIDVSLGLIQHSVYYKVAKRCKHLDRLLLYRMKQEEDEKEEKAKLGEDETVDEPVERTYICYSADCRQAEEHSKCYSPDCRRLRARRSAQSGKESTEGAHRLKLKQGQSNCSVWMQEGSSAMPPAPTVHTFRANKTHSKDKMNILILPRHALKKLARKGGVQDTVEGFNHSAKSNAHVWPYPCFRPTFQTCWRYHLQMANSLHSIALLLRVLYHNIRWDEVTLTRELNATYWKKFDTYSEQRVLCGHQLVPPFGLRIRYWVRVTRVSNEYRTYLTSTYGDADCDHLSSDESFEEEDDDDANYRSRGTRQSAPWKLRERKKPRKSNTKNYEKSERWMDDDALVLWEMKNYWFRRERDRRITRPSPMNAVGGNVGRGGAVVQNTQRTKISGIANNAQLSLQSQKGSGQPSVSIPIPAPNSSLVVDLGDGHQLLVSNQPREPGGPCVITVQALAASTPSDQAQSSAQGDHGYKTTPTTGPSRGRVGTKRSRKRETVQTPQLEMDDESMEGAMVGSMMDMDGDDDYEESMDSTMFMDEGPPELEPNAKRSRSSGRNRRPKSTAVVLNACVSNWKTMDAEEKKRYQDCKTVLGKMIDIVVAGDRTRQREETKNQGNKSRVQYWRDYRLKRKGEKMRMAAMNSRIDRWKREVTKRRESQKGIVKKQIRWHLNNKILEKIVAERTLLGWPQPVGPVQLPPRSPPIMSPMELPESDQSSDEEPVRVKRARIEPSMSHQQREPRNRRQNRENKMTNTCKSQLVPTEPMPVLSAITTSTPVKKSEPAETSVSEELHCICRKPLDRTKFYVMCDLCGRWFHGKCVGITERKSKHMSTWSCHECQKAKEEARQELYCICQTPYDESKPYICCDSCDGWFHCSCVGISPSEAEYLPSFICPKCRGKTEEPCRAAPEEISSSTIGTKVSPLVTAITKQLDQRDYQCVEMLVRGLQEHQMSWPFRQDVDSSKHPLYHQIVKNHIDLSTIEKKVAHREYSTLADLSRDVISIFNNARNYYPTDAPEFQCATVLDQNFTKELRDVKLTIAASVDQGHLSSSPNLNGNAF